ncbi:MAG TPA: AEC family transporter, partial [Caldimonas sp.]
MSPLVFVKLFAIFAVVAIGWAVARSGRLGGGDASRVLSGAAFYIFVPALLFRTSARIDFARLEARILLAFFVPTVALLLIVYVALRFGARRAAAAPAAPSVRAITATFGNSVQIGIPLAAALFGESGLALHVTLVSLHALTLLTILTALVELDLAHAQRRAEPGRTPLAATLATTAKNTIVHPVVLPVLAGLAWNASGWALPIFADEILATLGQAVVPLCLVLIGVSLAHYGVRGALRGAVVLSIVKLVVMPLAVLLFAR